MGADGSPSTLHQPVPMRWVLRVLWVCFTGLLKLTTLYESTSMNMNTQYTTISEPQCHCPLLAPHHRGCCCPWPTVLRWSSSSPFHCESSTNLHCCHCSCCSVSIVVIVFVVIVMSLGCPSCQWSLAMLLCWLLPWSMCSCHCVDHHGELSTHYQSA
jgi:hypothetical protein